MNDYAIFKHGFLDNNIKNAIINKEVNDRFKITPKKTDLYSMVTLEEINKLKKLSGLKRIKIIAQDGLTDYFRRKINEMDEETFNLYLKYHLCICEKKEFLGTSSHVLDILKK